MAFSFNPVPLNNDRQYVWRKIAPILILFIFLLPGSARPAANDANLSYADLHKLNADELQQLVDSESGISQTRASLVFARSISRRNFAEGKAQLMLLNDKQMATNEQVYLYAIDCGISVRSGDMQAAGQACESAKLALTEGLNLSVQAQAYDALGSLATRQGRIPEALSYYEKGLSAAVAADDRELLYVLHHNRATPLINMGLTDLAIQSLETSRRYMAVLPEDSQLPGILLYNLAYVQAQRGAHREALQEYLQAIDWLEALQHNSRIYIAKTQVAIAHTALGEPQLALDTLLPWMQREDLTLSPDSIADAYHALAGAYIALNQLPRAEKMINDGLAIAQAQANPLRLQQLSLAQINLTVQQLDYERAESLLSELIVTYTQETNFRVSMLDRMASIQAAMGDYQQAWAYSREHKALDAKVRSQDFDLRLSALRVVGELDQANYDLAIAREREKATALQSVSARTTRNGAILGAIFILAIGFLLFRRVIEKREATVAKKHTLELEKQVSERTSDMQHEMQRRIEAEQANTDLQQRIAEDERLRTIGQLTGGVAHDFNNLLTVILLSADMLKEDPKENNATLLEDIIHAGESGKAITQSLLAYARQQELQPEPMRLDKFLGARTSLFQRTLGDTIILDMNLQPATITVDKGQLTTCLINLLFNARDAMGKNGKLKIDISNLTDNEVHLSIADNGSGMTEATQTRATEPFYTTKFDGGGSGLGLSMAYGFMKQSGGDLTIRSVETTGTTVTLAFPSSTAGDVTDTEAVQPEPFQNKFRKVLLIDDQDGVRDVCRAALESMNFTVFEASSGVQAMEYILSGDHFDLVVSDAVMPGGISGLEVASTLAEVQPDLPIILMSGGPVDTPDNCLFLAKPFSLEQLETTVREAMS